ncbi:MAG TPA: hypothetical protein VM432_00470 [Bdellovibrionales bacterium]|nr:hypothetical protein [Bdellovibrionales bacterium]
MAGGTQDPFEEFEFQPLTEGLGFHKKAESLKNDIKSADLGSALLGKKSEKTIEKTAPSAPLAAAFDSAPRKTATQSISELMASLPPSLDFLDEKPDLARAPASGPTLASAQASSTERPQIFQPLTGPTIGAPAATPAAPTSMPSPGKKAGGFATTPITAAIPAPITNSTYRDRMSESFAKSFPHAEKAKAPAEALIPVPAGIASGIVDAMMVAGVATVLLVCILQITQINLVGMLTNATTDGPTQMNLALLYLAVFQMYMLVSRVFFGATLGEWAFELQLGRDQQQTTFLYPLQVIARTVLTTITGFLFLPLLSIVFNRDIAKYFTGLQLYRRP